MWIVYPAFNIYLGWITVATIANTTAVLVHFGWEGGFLSPVAWTILMIAIATGMGTYFGFFRRNIPYTLVIIWALFGIYLARTQEIVPGAKGIIYATLLGMIICTVSIASRLFPRTAKAS